MEHGTVEGCVEDTGRGDTLVEGTLAVVMVGCASGCRDVDEARGLRRNIQLHLNHCFDADGSPFWGLGMAMRVEGNLTQLATHEPAQLSMSGISRGCIRRLLCLHQALDMFCF